MNRWIEIYIRFPYFKYKYKLLDWWNRESGWIYYKWHRIFNYLPDDEFHPCLFLDANLIVGIDEKRKNQYLDDITERRRLAHIKDLKLSIGQ